MRYTNPRLLYFTYIDEYYQNQIFPTGQLAESDYWQEQFHTISKDVSVRNVLMHSAH